MIDAHLAVIGHGDRSLCLAAILAGKVGKGVLGHPVGPHIRGGRRTRSHVQLEGCIAHGLIVRGGAGDTAQAQAGRKRALGVGIVGSSAIDGLDGVDTGRNAVSRDRCASCAVSRDRDGRTELQVGTACGAIERHGASCMSGHKPCHLGRHGPARDNATGGFAHATDRRGGGRLEDVELLRRGAGNVGGRCLGLREHAVVPGILGGGDILPAVARPLLDPDGYAAFGVGADLGPGSGSGNGNTVVGLGEVRHGDGGQGGQGRKALLGATVVVSVSAVACLYHAGRGIGDGTGINEERHLAAIWHVCRDKRGVRTVCRVVQGHAAARVTGDEARDLRRDVPARECAVGHDGVDRGDACRGRPLVDTELLGVASGRVAAGCIGRDDNTVVLARGVVRIVAGLQGLVNVIPAVVLLLCAVFLELDVDCPVGGSCHALEGVVSGDGNPVEGLGEIRHADVRGIVDGQLAGGPCGAPIGEGLAFHGCGHGIGIAVLGAGAGAAGEGAQGTAQAFPLPSTGDAARPMAPLALGALGAAAAAAALALRSRKSRS